MTTGSVDSVKELRERTGAGIMDCKAALQATGGDLEKAIDFLRKKGMAQAAKRAGREAKEGLIVGRVQGSKAALVEVNCETDFVARTDDFKALASMALEDVLSQGEAALSSAKINDRLAELSGKIGEKMLVKRGKALQSADGSFFCYIHATNKLGVLVELSAGKAETKKNNLFEELGKNLAMQVAASNPICLKRDQVPAATLEREKAIYREEVKGKPENIVEKIILGKLDKFYQSQCLMEQPFVKDDKVSIEKLVTEAGKKIGDTIQVRQFVRFQLGETVPAS
ncbi:MAG TPA: translation elongation factor Ts [Candidatus Omnitrophota bacterium]|nr:translation elongation factor Ts [Candidatus Omnitrophota bacterium]